MAEAAQTVEGGKAKARREEHHHGWRGLEAVKYNFPELYNFKNITLQRLHCM
jgi:hypothetical protein